MMRLKRMTLALYAMINVMDIQVRSKNSVGSGSCQSHSFQSRGSLTKNGRNRISFLKFAGVIPEARGNDAFLRRNCFEDRRRRREKFSRLLKPSFTRRPNQSVAF